MILILHVVIALSSMLVTAVAYVQPSVLRLRASYGLVGLTLLSGFYLVWTTPSSMVQACMSGVAYLSVVMVGIVATRRKLVRTQHTVA